MIDEGDRPARVIARQPADIPTRRLGSLRGALGLTSAEAEDRPSIGQRRRPRGHRRPAIDGKRETELAALLNRLLR